jgi:branched-chain amino acid transport system permease protein
MRPNTARAARPVFLVALFLFARPWPADATESGAIEAYTWDPVTPTSPAVLPAAGQTTPTRNGTIFVAAAGGKEAARSYLAIRHGDAAGIQAIHLVLRESTESLNANKAVVRACPSTPLATANDPNPPNPPAVECSTTSSVGVRAADGTWTFDLIRLAAAWTDDTIHTVALVSVPSDPTVNYSVAYTAQAATIGIEHASVSVADGSAETSLSPVLVPPPSRTAVPRIPSATPSTSATSSSPPLPTDSTAATTRAPVPGAIRSINTPATAMVECIVLLLTGVVLAAKGWRPAATMREIARDGRLVPGARLGVGLAGAAFLLLAPAMFSEATVFQLGLVLIFFTAALGLHVLVNWAGELSLAHAGIVGLPAFVLAKLAADHGWSPIELIPLGIAVGVIAGTVIALPALRTSGLYVAITTLAAGIAIDRFFFTRDWLITVKSNNAPPSLFGITFASTNSLYPVIVVLSGLGLAAALVLHRSKLVRGMLWMRVDRTAAAAFGIPVGRQRVMAFAVAGAYAGLAGGMTFTWTSLASASMFPLTLALSYLAAVVVAGSGGVGGLIVAVALLEGGRYFVPGSDEIALYAGPIALMLVLTRFPSGINGLGRLLMKKLTADARTDVPTTRTTSGAGFPPQRDFAAGFVAGILAMAAGFSAIVVAWYHTGNTDQLWIQTQEFLLGGLGGLGLILLGATLLLRDALLRATRSSPSFVVMPPENGAATPADRPLRADRSHAGRTQAPT